MITELLDEVERISDSRIADVIAQLVARRPTCRKMNALSTYVALKLQLHREVKKDRYRDVVCNVLVSKINELRILVRDKRSVYYSTDCDCDCCKQTN
jgi:hypothetical protein